MRFETAPRAVESAAERADVACFVGFVALREGELPEAVWEAWRRLGWRHLLPTREQVAAGEGSVPDPALPVRVDNIETFDALFDGWVRLPNGTSYEGHLAGAVRDFFRQGGQRCYVVPAGAPRPSALGELEVAEALDALIPGPGAPVDPSERGTWRGIGHLLGLPDVAMLCIPDLPAMVGAPASAPPEPVPEAVGVPVFAVCAPEPPTPPGGAQYRAPGVPRLGEAEWAAWKQAMIRALDFIKAQRRDVQLLAALPLPEEGSPEEADPMRLLDAAGLDLLAPHGAGVGSAWLQLAWPWLKSDTSVDRRGGLAPPDGVLAGLLARNSLKRGTFRVAVREPVHGILGCSPKNGAAAQMSPRTVNGWDLELALVDRVCLIASDRWGYSLYSDNTATAAPLWRQGGVNRLMGVILRALQRVGEGAVFQHSGPDTWLRLRRAVEATLDGLAVEGALGGKGAPYQVRCDRRTMSQADLDAGRLVCEVVLQPTPAIERIIVTLAVAGSARTDVRGARGEA
ncbi:MAG: phage tail sheath family protein [Alphaproteobacteria bacterium]|nr:phage tail sheath family protein [Alphaproteobacteria bacterium]MCB9791542.1 phage tail sheath family protein [Alphaproteobacteria bacterium]